MAVQQGNTPQAQEIRFSPKNRVKLTTPETEYIYNEAVAPLAGAYQYYELVPGGGTSGVVYRFPPGTDFEALEKFEAEHPDIQVTFRTGRPAPPNAAYAEPLKITPLERREAAQERGAAAPNFEPTPLAPVIFKSDQPPPQPTYGHQEPDRDTQIRNVLEYTEKTFGEAPSFTEAKKKLKAFGSGAPLSQKMLQEFLPYTPKSDPDIRVHDVRTGSLQATLVGKQAAEAAKRSGMGVWKIPESYVGEYSGRENQYIVYRPGDAKKRDEVLKILEAYPLGYRGRQYFQEMGRAMGVPEILTNNFVNTFYKNPTIIPEGVTAPAKTESPKWLGLIAVATIALIFLRKPAPTQGA